MKASTRRKVRFNNRFNWNDKNPERGFININGEAMGVTKIEIHYKGIDLDLDLNEHPIVEDPSDHTLYNFSNVETIIFGYPTEDDVSPKK